MKACYQGSRRLTIGTRKAVNLCCFGQGYRTTLLADFQGTRIRLRLPYHNPADRCREGQLMDVVLVEGIDTARVPFSPYLIDRFHHLQTVGDVQCLFSSHLSGIHYAGMS